MSASTKRFAFDIATEAADARDLLTSPSTSQKPHSPRKSRAKHKSLKKTKRRHHVFTSSHSRDDPSPQPNPPTTVPARLGSGTSKKEADFSSLAVGKSVRDLDNIPSDLDVVGDILLKIENGKDSEDLSLLYDYHKVSAHLDVLSDKLEEYREYIAGRVSLFQDSLSERLKLKAGLSGKTKLLRIVDEFLSTEETYVNALDLLVGERPDSFQAMMTQFARDNSLDLDPLTKGFHGLASILSVQRRFLDALRKTVSEYKTKEKIGELVEEWASTHFFVYSEFVTSQDDNALLFNDLLQSKGKYHKHFSKIMVKPHPEKAAHPFMSIFFGTYQTPVQRLPRVMLLLREIKKNLPPDHHDIPHIDAGSAAVDKVIRTINEKIQDKKNYEMALAMKEEKRLKSIFTFLSPKREKEKYGFNRPKTARGLADVRRLKGFLKVDSVWNVLDGRATCISEAESHIYVFDDVTMCEALYTSSSTESYSVFPTALLWVKQTLSQTLVEAMGIQYENTTDLANLSMIYSPTRVWAVKVGKDALKRWCERIATIAHIEDATNPIDMGAGLRDGSAYNIFLRSGGRYCGSWKGAFPHGKGYYRRFDGSKFEGLWSSDFKAGYGTVTISTRRDKESGKTPQSKFDGFLYNMESPFTANSQQQNMLELELMSSMMPSGPIATDANAEVLAICEDETLKQNHFWDKKQLDDEDWNLICTAGKSRKVKKGDVIFKEGQSSMLIFLIVDGAIKLENDAVQANPPLFYHHEFFGFHSYFNQKCLFTATVEADGEIIGFSIDLLVEIFGEVPGLRYRFTFELCSRLYSLLGLIGRPAGKELDYSRLNEGNERLNEVKQDIEDDVYLTKLKFPSSEKLFKSAPVRKGPARGTLFLSMNYLTFFSETLGFMTINKFALETITKVEAIVDRVGLLVHARKHSKTKSTKFLFKLADERDQFLFLLESLIAVTANRDALIDFQADSENFLHLRSQSSHRQQSLSAYEFTSIDIGRIMAGAIELQVKAGDKMITQGQEVVGLYHVVEGVGEVEVEKDDGSSIVVGQILQGEYVGESSFLQAASASASIIAQNDMVINFIPFDHVSILFAKFPDFASKFYGYLSSIIHTRLRSRLAV